MSNLSTMNSDFFLEASIILYMIRC